MCDLHLSRQQECEEDAIVQLAIDIRESYNNIDIDIKPTQIGLATLLKFAGVLHRQLNGNKEDGSSNPDYTDKREERRRRRRARRAKYRLMASQSCKLIEVANEYSRCSRLAAIRTADDCASLVTASREQTTSQVANSRSDSPSCDREISNITHGIAQDGSQDKWLQANNAMNKRPSSWHSANAHPPTSGNTNVSSSYRHRHISDSDARLINEPYRLMTMTHNRLSSVSPPLDRCSSQLEARYGKKVQPVLGVRQRRRKQDQQRRRTVHGVVYDKPMQPSHRRSNSDTALHGIIYQRVDNYHLRQSKYHQTIDSQVRQQKANDPCLTKQVKQFIPQTLSEPFYARPLKSINVWGPTLPTPTRLIENSMDLGYKYNEVRSTQVGDQYYYEHRHQTGLLANEPMRHTEVCGRAGSGGYSIALSPAEMAIEEIWRHERELADDSQLSDCNNNPHTAASTTAASSATSKSGTLTPDRSHPPKPTRTKFSVPRLIPRHPSATREVESGGELVVKTQVVPDHQTNVTSSKKNRLLRSVKRTTSMPSNTQQPSVERRYPMNESVPPQRVARVAGSIPNGPSERPGRGVFTNSGRRVHEGQRHGDSNPPHLPARNSSPLRNGGRSMSSDRANIGQLANHRIPDFRNEELPNSWAKRHNGNPDWSYSSSEFSQKPIDQLRNRVRQQQEMEKQLRLSRSLPKQSNVVMHAGEGSSPQRQTTYQQDDEATNFGFQKMSSTHQPEAIEKSRRSREKYRRGDVNGVVTSEVSRSPSALTSNKSHLQQQTVPFKARVLSPQRPATYSGLQQAGDVNHQQQHNPTEPYRRAPSPEKPRASTDTQQAQYEQQEAAHPAPYITRTLSPSKSKQSHNNVKNKENWSVSAKSVGSGGTSHLQPSLHTSQPQNSLQKSYELDISSTQRRKAVTAKEYSEQPMASNSNKYKMLVCPDFFPVAKLNGFPKKKPVVDRALEDDVFFNPPAEYSGTQEIGSFYSRRSGGIRATQPMIQIDDSFVEDPKQQLLYPPDVTVKRTKSQAKDSANFYFEVTPTSRTNSIQGPSDDRGVFTTLQCSPQLATEGDSLYSIHSSQRVPESGASLQSSHTSEGSQSSSTVDTTNRVTSPPAYHQAVQRSQIGNNFRNNFPTSTAQEPYASQRTHEVQTTQSEDYLEYQETSFVGQKSQTARVLAHIEPSDIVEGSHYATVSVYRGVQTQPTSPTAPPFKPAWQQKSSPPDKAPRVPARNAQPDEADVASGPNQPKAKPSVSPRIPRGEKHIAQFVDRDSSRQTKTHQTVAIRGSAVSQLGVYSHVPQPNRSKNLPEMSRSHDDKLLEHIKAQSSTPTHRLTDQEPVYQRIPIKENFYENLPHFEPVASQTKPPARHQRNSFTNPDYVYTATVLSQSEPVKHSHKHSVKGTSSPHSNSAKSHPHVTDRTSNLDQLELRAQAVKQSQIDDSHNKLSHPLMSHERATPGSLAKDQSSTTGSETDDSLEKQRSANFVEPPKQYTRYMESPDSSEKLEDSMHSEAFDMSTNELLAQAADTHHGRQLPTSQDRKVSSTLTDVDGEEEINQLMEHLATANRSEEKTAKGLGDDILSITKMWKNLPTKDSWDDKRRALLGDPIMSSITEKMEAILHTSSDVTEQREKTTLSRKNEASGRPGVEQMSPQSPSDVGLVTREPGEGSSDDLDESADLTLKRIHHHQLNQSPLSTPKNKHTSNQSRSSIPVSQSWNAKSTTPHRSGIPIRQRRMETNQSPSSKRKQSSSNPKPTYAESTSMSDIKESKDGAEGVKVIHIADSDEDEGDLSADMFKVKRQSAYRVAMSSKSQPLTSSREMSESEESGDSGDDAAEEMLDVSTERQDESDDTDNEIAEESGAHYLSDYHRMKVKSKHKKKISFSTDAKKSRPGDLIAANQSKALLSVDPFRTSSPTPEPSKHLLSLNPFRSDLATSATASPESDADHSLGKRPKQGILKRSEESAGSQLSLGTCSEFGSHISLASGDSGMSRAGSFPLLTMSDGSKKDFKITFNDEDTHDMGNLFKVVRKARSEGAASEPESTDSDSDDDAMPVVCKNCQAKQPLFKARLVYKMCHGCYTYYCSSECRRQDWTTHKPLCIVSRLSSLARKIFKCVMTDQELLHHCSRFARTGYLCEGRGAVVLSFSSPRKAQLFLSNAKQAKESALYLCVKDLQKFSFDDKRDKDQLISNCKHYNPDEKFVLHLAIKMTRSLSGQSVEPRIRGREFHKWARIRLSDRHNVPKGDRFDEEDTLILTAHSSVADQNNQSHSDVKAREVFFATVVTKLRKRGISLRHQYPDVYTALCQYVTNGRVFAPISLFAFNLHTHKRFMCCIMPYSDQDVTWGNNPHLMEDLDLVVNL